MDLTILWNRYKKSLLSRHFAITALSGFLILASWLVGQLAPDKSWLSDTMAVAATLIGGFPIVAGAVRGLLSREINVDELVSIAIVGSLLGGEYLPAAIIAWIMLIGSFLEELTATAAKDAIRRLVDLSPKVATVRRAGREERVPIREVVVGDLVLVRSGDQIPVDGIVARGHACVNEASITGESRLVDKMEGDLVHAGTINELGAMEIKTTSVGEDTTLGQIIQLVREAETHTAPIQRLADRYASWFTPSILVFALATFLLTGDPRRAITVLIVACPCALVLATPTAVVAGIGRAAKRGILIKGGKYLEAVGGVDALLFDKTGTITLGKPRVAEIVSVDYLTQEEILTFAVSAEKFSEHPLGKAIVEEGSRRGIVAPDPNEFHVLPGRGVIANVDGEQIVLGNRDLLRYQGIDTRPEISSTVARLERDRKSVLFVVMDGRISGLISVSDVTREQAHSTIERLRDLGIHKVIMLTGDDHHIAAEIADQIGLDEFYAQLLPEQKVHHVRALEEAGYKTAMVGDGINDAPALATASVGIAMGLAGTDVAIETADIALMTDDLTKVAELILLSRQVIRVIKQNIWLFGVFLNLGGIIAASVGGITPIAGAILHNIASVAVVLNSARLAFQKYTIPSS